MSLLLSPLAHQPTGLAPTVLVLCGGGSESGRGGLKTALLLRPTGVSTQNIEKVAI